MEGLLVPRVEARVRLATAISIGMRTQPGAKEGRQQAVGGVLTWTTKTPQEKTMIVRMRIAQQ